jgi:hypothetical protein
LKWFCEGGFGSEANNISLLIIGLFFQQQPNFVDCSLHKTIFFVVGTVLGFQNYKYFYKRFNCQKMMLFLAHKKCKNKELDVEPGKLEAGRD